MVVGFFGGSLSSDGSVRSLRSHFWTCRAVDAMSSRILWIYLIWYDNDEDHGWEWWWSWLYNDHDNDLRISHHSLSKNRHPFTDLRRPSGRKLKLPGREENDLSNRGLDVNEIVCFNLWSESWDGNGYSQLGEDHGSYTRLDIHWESQHLGVCLEHSSDRNFSKDWHFWEIPLNTSAIKSRGTWLTNKAIWIKDSLQRADLWHANWQDLTSQKTSLGWIWWMEHNGTKKSG